MTSDLLRALIVLLTLGVCSVSAGTLNHPQDLSKLRSKARKSDLPAARLQALQDIAKLQPHLGSPDRAVTNALAIGIADKDSSVRLGTVPLLDSTQHPEASVKILIKGLEAELTRWQRAATEIAGYNSSPEGKKLLKRIAQEDKQGVMRPIARPKYYDKLKLLSDAEEELAPVLDAFVQQLAEWKDDRSVKVLASALKETTHGPSARFLESSVSRKRCVQVAKSILKLGTKESLLAVTQSLDTWTTRQRTVDAKCEALKSKRGAEMQAFSLALSQSLNMKIVTLELLKELADFATEHDLPGIPAKDLKKSRWNAWAKTALESLPESLGQVDNPQD